MQKGSWKRADFLSLCADFLPNRADFLAVCADFLFDCADFLQFNDDLSEQLLASSYCLLASHQLVH